MSNQSEKHIYMVNAHPDDLNASLALAIIVSQLPCYKLHVVDLTRGERGLVEQGISMEKCKAG